MPSPRPVELLFVSHTLRLEGAPLAMQFLIKYFVKVLHLHVLAPDSSCDQPLRANLLEEP